MATYAGLTVVSGTVITAAWGNGVRDNTMHYYASKAARASSITAPVEGQGLTYLTDADEVNVYNGTKYLPVGPNVVDSLNITTGSPFLTGLGAGSATTEMSSKMRLTATRVYSGHLYRIRGTLLVQQSAAGSDWTMLCREDTASGTIVGTTYLSNVGLNGTTMSFEFLWPCAADASSKVFCFTYVRNAGAQTFSVYNTVTGGQCLFISIERMGDSTLYRTVP